MAALTGTLLKGTEFAGELKLLVVTATIESASDTITLTAASHGGAVSIEGIVGAVITGGLDAAFTDIQVSYSGLVLTVVSTEQDGTPSTAWGDTTVSISVLVKTTA